MRRVALAMIGAGGEGAAGEGAGVVEKTLPNGDVYRGGFSGGAPHGEGKYVWADECMYEGEWRRGKACGKGRFSWPSGATFEGEFRGGRIEGLGAFVGLDGASYRGAWVADRRHGAGAKSYANGDYYEGQWRWNLQDGYGRYVWANGNQYVGEWRVGVLSGRGVLIWANGSRYDGVWENGVPRGTGVFTWPDGSRYVGSWPRSCVDLPAISGIFFPPVAAGAAGAVRKRSSVEGVGEKVAPRICIWESEGEAGDITCDIVDALEASMFYREAMAVGAGAVCKRPQRTARRLASGGPGWASSAATTPESKRPGQTISKGHKNYELMLQLAIGQSTSRRIEYLTSPSPNRRFKRTITSWLKGEQIGSGSFGSVYEAISDDGFFFAVKEVSLLDQGLNAKQRILQLEHEISLLSRLEHENIVQYFGTDKEDGKLYIFLELVTQGSLATLYQKYRLQDSQVSAYTRQILNGLNYLHQRNVLHRDIKCANILVDACGLVKLADFGLAKEISILSQARSSKGTVYWMAPEVAKAKPHGPPADIWSLGCTVLEMLTGKVPYPDMEWAPALLKIGRGIPPEIPNTLSEDARDFIKRCVQANPNDRPSAAQLVEHPFVQRPLQH